MEHHVVIIFMTPPLLTLYTTLVIFCHLAGPIMSIIYINRSKIIVVSENSHSSRSTWLNNKLYNVFFILISLLLQQFLRSHFVQARPLSTYVHSSMFQSYT